MIVNVTSSSQTFSNGTRSISFEYSSAPTWRQVFVDAGLETDGYLVRDDNRLHPLMDDNVTKFAGFHFVSDRREHGGMRLYSFLAID